ncbi:MAG: DUF2220 family protein [Dehalococcoidales bacterium]|nr:DUF2220 family protein [Dehalococcoidales bacterium]
MPDKVERFVAELRRTGRRRIDLDGLWAAFRAITPEAASAPDRRQRLREQLDTAENAGMLRATQSRPDNSANPVLPRSVLLATASVLAPASMEPRTVWPEELAWAAELRLQVEEQTFLEQVRAFLRDLSPSEPIVPMRERSLQITGDEKRMEEYRRGRLFWPGRLTPELLRCRQVHPPFVWKKIDSTPVLLVVENHHTYDTFARLLEPSDGIGFLAYGAGNQFTASVTFVGELEPRVERVLYFGDIDLRGLWIPMQAAAKAEGEGLPTVTPAGGLYRALLAVGCKGKTASSVSDVKIRPHDVVTWLPADLREPVLNLLERGERMAQEGLGYTRLCDAQFRRRILQEKVEDEQMERRAPFTGTWDVVSSPDFDDDYLSMEVAPYVRLRQEGDKVVGKYQVSLQTGNLDGRLEGAERVLFSFEGMDELDPVNGAGTLTLKDDHLTFVLRYHLGDAFTFECTRQ